MAAKTLFKIRYLRSFFEQIEMRESTKPTNKYKIMTPPSENRSIPPLAMRYALNIMTKIMELAASVNIGSI